MSMILICCWRLTTVLAKFATSSANIRHTTSGISLVINIPVPQFTLRREDNLSINRSNIVKLDLSPCRVLHRKKPVIPNIVLTQELRLLYTD